MLLAGPAAHAVEGGEAASPKQYTYRVVNDDSLGAFVFSPPRQDDRPVHAILLFHGGGWSAGSAEWVFASASRFAQWSLVAIAVDYRLSEGDVTPIDALGDVCAAFAWARAHAAELGIDGKLAGYGVSAGAHLVAASATIGCGTGRKGPDALLLWSPALDVTTDAWFTKLLQGRARAVDYSPANHVGKSTPPTSIVHGAADTLTPLSGSQKFHDAMIEAGGVCELHVYEGVGHLLTRNLANQEDNFDPDPAKRADGVERHRRFLVSQGFITETR
jgi:acetyl esterase/lipase